MTNHLMSWGCHGAMMAWKLAKSRYPSSIWPPMEHDIGPWPREMLNPEFHGQSAEYYLILDKAESQRDQKRVVL